MSWGYSGDPSKSSKDHVRFLIGDTDQTWQLLQDEEIEHLLTETSDPVLAASKAAEGIAARFARQADTRNEGLSVSASQRVKQFRDLAQELKVRASRSAEVFAGGRSKDAKREFGQDEDTVQPAFVRGQDDHPDAALGGHEDEDEVV